MTTKKQLLVRAQTHLAKNEEEPLTCHICIAIDISATLTIQELVSLLSMEASNV